MLGMDGKALCLFLFSKQKEGASTDLAFPCPRNRINILKIGWIGGYTSNAPLGYDEYSKTDSTTIACSNPDKGKTDENQ